MIEFKADCGHTVRAKDEDSGKVVRCAYCGREAQVPEDDAGDFDSFFADVGQENLSDQPVAKSSKGSGKKKAGAFVGPRPRKVVDPFNVVTKMAYVAVILIAVIFVGKKYAWPIMSETLFPGAESSKSVGPMADAKRTPKPKPKPIKPKAPSRKYGLVEPRLEARGKQGIYVNAVPPKVKAFYRPQTEGSQGYQWLEDPMVKRIRGPSYLTELQPGAYDVVVMLPVNDPQLKRFRNFGYSRFRASVEREKPKEADKEAATYFLPDGAQAVKILHMSDRINIIRHYQEIICAGEWQVLTPLFIPFECPMSEVAAIVPRGVTSFRFDTDDIRDELAYYHVVGEDQTYIVDVLERIGSISYHAVPPGADDNHEYPFRMFRISPVDGIFTARYLEGFERKPLRAVAPP